MNHAPKRIWTFYEPVFETYVTNDHGDERYTPDYAVEYIRADLVPQWKPIETAPKDGTEVVLWDGVYINYAAWRLDDYIQGDGPQWLKDDFDDFSCGYASTPLTPTHWMPTPNPPTGPK